MRGVLWSLLTVLGMAAGEKAFVQADVVRLRHDSSSESEVMGAVRLNTELQVEDVKGDWVQVTHVPSDTTGWISGRFLGPRPVELASVQAQLADGGTGNAVGALEQWLALEPNRLELYPRLAEAYRAAKKPERAALLERRVKGGLPTMLGVCLAPFRRDFSTGGWMPLTERSFVVLVASYAKGAMQARTIARAPAALAGDGGVSSLDQADEAPEAQPLWGAVSDVANLFWMQEDGTVPPGSPFPSPTLHGYSSYAGDFFAVRLGTGPCDPGTLWASAPAESVTLTPAQQAALKAADKARPLRSPNGDRLHASDTHHWVRPAFSDGSVLAVRTVSGNRDPVSYLGFELTLLTPKNQVRRQLLWFQEELD